MTDQATETASPGGEADAQPVGEQGLRDSSPIDGNEVKRLRRETPFYLIPIMMGMAGVWFSSQLQDPYLQAPVVLLCVGVPLFVGGNILSRLRGDWLQRFLLTVGLALLTIGAVVAILGYSDSIVSSESVSPEVGLVSRYLGLGSLCFGMLVVLWSVVRSQALIDELSAQFRNVADHMGEGFILTDYDGKIVLVNPSLCEMTGVSEDDIVGRNALDLARELGVEAMAWHAETRQEGKSSEYQVNWNRNGEERQFWISGSPVYNAKRRRVGAIATVRDISEQRMLNERLERYAKGLQRLVDSRTKRLRESEERMRELLMRMDEGFLTVDVSYTIVFANDRICDVLRVPHNALVGRNILNFADGEGRQRLRERFQRAAVGEDTSADLEYNFVRGDVGHVPVKVSVACIDDSDDEESTGERFSLVVTDVQQLKDMQHQMELRARQLEQVNEELRELDKAKDIFLTNVSHELRTPLSTIQGYVEMLGSGNLGELQGPQGGAIKVMERNVQRLSSLINEMIEFSRMEIRGVKLSKTLFGGQRFVSESVESHHPIALGKNITISTYIEDDLPCMWGDRAKLAQVLGILLSNAIKFSKEGGSIQVRVNRRDNAGVAIAIADTGIGIEDADQEKVFQKFFQVDSSMTRYYQGTGIGLSIAKNIVEAHGGHIELESTPRKGSTFTVVLAEALFVPDTELSPREGYKGARVLVANARSEFRNAVAQVLAAVGLDIEETRMGYDCVRIAQEAQPDVIVVDEALPDISGAETVELLKKEIGVGDIPVIVMESVEQDAESEPESMINGVHTLVKPFTVSALLAAVESALEEGAGIDDSLVSEELL